MYEFDADRIAKIRTLQAEGIHTWPAGYPVTHSAADVRALHAALPEGTQLSELGADLCLAGRLMFKNEMGKAGFGRMLDGSGRIQFYVRKDDVGEEAFALWRKLDLGDIVGIRGGLMVTRTGELSVHVLELTLLSKCVRSLPDKFHGLSDPELRQRQRYVDLFVNEERREIFRRRAATLRYLRDAFDARGYLEVETPILHPIVGGATARPFVTHHNALETDLYLRVAPELYLKRLVVGGLERVYEINRSFRNEGIDSTHNPEFTMLEFYQAYATWQDLVELTEELLHGLVLHVLGAEVLTYQGQEISFARPFRQAGMDELIAEATGLSRADMKDLGVLRAWWTEHQADGPPLPATLGRAWELLFETLVERSLVQPTFVTRFPIEISPLARRNDEEPDIADRFELYVGGRELANGFTELNDPVDQAERFAAQASAKSKGDEEAMHFDEDYIDALCFGLPPTAGEGLGVDRLVMFLTDSPSIRDVILFPTLRPRLT